MPSPLYIAAIRVGITGPIGSGGSQILLNMADRFGSENVNIIIPRIVFSPINLLSYDACKQTMKVNITRCILSMCICRCLQTWVLDCSLYIDVLLMQVESGHVIFAGRSGRVKSSVSRIG